MEFLTLRGNGRGGDHKGHRRKGRVSVEAYWSDTKLNDSQKNFTVTTNTDWPLQSHRAQPSLCSLGEGGHQYSHHNQGVFLALVLQARG